MSGARWLPALLLAGASGLAQALTVAELQQLLQRAPRPDVRYQEVRESPWLDAPVTTRGMLRVTPQALEKRVESPRQETWRLLADRVEWTGPGGAGHKQILFKQAPGLQPLADATRRAVTGDLLSLERDFHIVLHGSAEVWSAQLEPRSAGAMGQLEAIELQGTGDRLRVLIVTERQGDRTTTRLLP